uniref:Uncharacterized protein n=1 Tax=Glossina pallidipes TaxID=7398 RepID=A0A1A9ZQP3_GLOPL
MPATESLKRLTSAAADSFFYSLTKTFCYWKYRETLRKYPPYPFLLRLTTKDYNLPNREFPLKCDKLNVP